MQVHSRVHQHRAGEWPAEAAPAPHPPPPPQRLPYVALALASRFPSAAVRNLQAWTRSRVSVERESGTIPVPAATGDADPVVSAARRTSGAHVSCSHRRGPCLCCACSWVRCGSVGPQWGHAHGWNPRVAVHVGQRQRQVPYRVTRTVLCTRGLGNGQGTHTRAAHTCTRVREK